MLWLRCLGEIFVPSLRKNGSDWGSVVNLLLCWPHASLQVTGLSESAKACHSLENEFMLKTCNRRPLPPKQKLPWYKRRLTGTQIAAMMASVTAEFLLQYFGSAYQPPAGLQTAVKNDQPSNYNSGPTLHKGMTLHLSLSSMPWLCWLYPSILECGVHESLNRSQVGHQKKTYLWGSLLLPYLEMTLYDINVSIPAIFLSIMWRTHLRAGRGSQTGRSRGRSIEWQKGSAKSGCR